jgi:excisionase family DNA binding protein
MLRTATSAATIVTRTAETPADLSTSSPAEPHEVDNRHMTSPGSGGEIGRFLTLAETAELLAVDVATVDELVRSGELPAIRVGTSGPWRVERTQLEVWIDEQYEATRRHTAWNQGEFANIVELSGARQGRLRPVD